MKRRLPSGPTARFFLLVIVASLTGCASGPSGEQTLRPSVQHLPTVRAQGDLIIATVTGATVTVEPLTVQGLDAYYARRPTLLHPFKTLPKAIKRPLAFVLRIQNVGRDRINVDPGQAVLVDEQARRVPAFSYDELYALFAERRESARSMRALEETALTGYLVVPPKLEREGLLLFPPPDPAAKAIILELGSFYVGSTEQPLVFEFEVRRAP